MSLDRFWWLNPIGAIAFCLAMALLHSLPVGGCASHTVDLSASVGPYRVQVCFTPVHALPSSQVSEPKCVDVPADQAAIAEERLRLAASVQALQSLLLNANQADERDADVHALPSSQSSSASRPGPTGDTND